VIYARRRELLSRDDLKEDVLEIAESIAEDLVASHADADVASEEWDWKALDDAVFAQFNFRLGLPEDQREALRVEALQDMLVERVRQSYEQREQQFGPPILRHLEKLIMLQTLDTLWKDHLLSMDHLKEGIGLRGYGHHDPLVEYKKESFEMFEAMMKRFQEDTVRYLYLMQILERPPDAGAGGPTGQVPDSGVPAQHGGDGNGRRPPRMVSTSADELEEAFMRRKRRELEQARMAGGGEAQQVQQVVRGQEKVGRNDPCPCGSGKKYKKCHGA